MAVDNHIAIGSVVEVRQFAQNGTVLTEQWLSAIVRDLDEATFVVEKVDGSQFAGGEVTRRLRRSEYRSHWR